MGLLANGLRQVKVQGAYYRLLLVYCRCITLCGDAAGMQVDGRAEAYGGSYGRFTKKFWKVLFEYDTICTEDKKRRGLIR